MSLLTDIMGETRGIVNDVLGHPCQWINAETDQETTVMVIINAEVELYQNHQFVGVVTTGVFDKAACDPKLGDRLNDIDTGISYTLDGIKPQETSSKIEFILGKI